MKGIANKPVIVEWEDSVQYDEGWHLKSDIKPDDVKYCISYGEIVAEDDDSIVVAGHVGRQQDGHHEQSFGMLTIPRSAILSIRRLNRGKLLVSKNPEQ